MRRQKNIVELSLSFLPNVVDLEIFSVLPPEVLPGAINHYLPEDIFRLVRTKEKIFSSDGQILLHIRMDLRLPLDANKIDCVIRMLDEYYSQLNVSADELDTFEVGGHEQIFDEKEFFSNRILFKNITQLDSFLRVLQSRKINNVRTNLLVRVRMIRNDTLKLLDFREDE